MQEKISDAESRDRSMFSTISLYITEEHLRDYLSKKRMKWTRPVRENLQRRLRQEAWAEDLREAIDPLLNDIAVRDRKFAVDFIVASPDPHPERIQLSVPADLEWETEGESFVARLGKEVVREAIVRSFWWVHASGAISYHLSLETEYADGSLPQEREESYRRQRFENLYFLSALQKLIFPKELPHTAQKGNAAGRADEGTGVFLLDRKSVRARVSLADPKAPEQAFRFWEFVETRFNEGFSYVMCEIGAAGRSGRKPPRQATADAFQALLPAEELLEVPGVLLPPAKALFLLKDASFFELLQLRSQKLKDGYSPYLPEPELSGAGGGRSVRPITAQSLNDIESGGEHSPLHAEYYFLSGFLQNIIDFLNQDRSEILDGTDTIYPATQEQRDEAFFFRAANANALYQIVSESRSLEVGRPHIGTCPYIFLVHLMALNNETLVRLYESDVSDQFEILERSDDDTPLEVLLGDIDGRNPGTGKESTRQKILAFYPFRHRAFSEYKRFLSANTFRYDTEAQVFDELARIRGVDARLNYCDNMLDGISQTVRSLEENLRIKEQREQHDADGTMNRLLTIVGLYAVFQTILALHDTIAALMPADPQSTATCHHAWFNLVCSPGPMFTVVGILAVLVVGMTFVVVGFLAVTVIKQLGNKMRARLSRRTVRGAHARTPPWG